MNRVRDVAEREQSEPYVSPCPYCFGSGKALYVVRSQPESHGLITAKKKITFEAQ